MKQCISRVLAFGTIFVLLVVGLDSGAAEVAKKVAVLPFQINAAQDLSYLREGIVDMLTSRLAWEGKVEVIEKQAVKGAMAGRQGMVNEAIAREVGKSLGADYVLFGSLTVFGESVSIDAKMLSLTEEKPPVTVYAQTKGMDEVIPRINDFAQDINNRIFGRQPTAVVAATQPRFSQENPEKMLVPGFTQGQAQQPRSELNPSFMVPSSGTLPTGAFWQGQNLPIAVTSMAVADANGDGIQEIILLSPRELQIYQQQANSLHLLKSYKGDSDDHFLWVSTGDLNHNKIPEIYVSDRRREELLSSFVLEWNGSDWVRIAEGIRYHLRVANLPGKGAVLLGQGSSRDEPFAAGVFVMQKEGGEYKPLDAVPLPRGANIYSFTEADLAQSGSREILFVERSGRLKITMANSELLWESDDRFANSFDYLQGVDTDVAGHLGVRAREKHYLNAPILIADLNQDGRPEVIVNKNIAGLFGRDLFKLNFFGKSELYSYSWNGLTLVENWHTPAFQGMTTAYEVADLGGSGKKDLLVVLVTSPGTAIWENANSKLIVYPIASAGEKKN